MTVTLDDLFPGRRPVLLDGGMGTTLRSHGWDTDEPTVLANLLQPRLVSRVHAAHREAGASVLLTNTFSALLLEDARQAEAVAEGVRLAREVAGDGVKVAGAVAAFGLAVGDPELQRVLAVLLDAGVDLIVFETCNRAQDAVQALELHACLARQVPMVVCASTTTGDHADHERVREVLALVQAAKDPAVEAGLNCGRGPHEALRLLDLGAQPVRWVKPNTGVGAERVEDEVMAAFTRAAVARGVRFVGGCCGTRPDTLAAMGAAMSGPTSS
jgi:methionine synthase I (cobalamin-dependent)